MRRDDFYVWLGALGVLSTRTVEGLPDDMGGTDALMWLQANERLTAAQVARLEKLVRADWPARELERCERSNVRVVTPRSEDYPEELEQIAEPPLALYVRGDLTGCRDAVAVVGTRRCTAYGARIAAALGERLARAHVPVVSGGAMGIDGAAHGGALEGGGLTAAVLGTGVDTVWPRGHEDLFANMLASGGALISEYPLGTPGRPWHFPRRNRIVAALARSLVVVESPERSGALITARLAMEMGRELWAVPGRIDEAVCAGSNRLLEDGALPLVNLSSFVQAITGLGQMELFDGRETGLSDAEARGLAALRHSGDQSVDQVASVASLTPPEALAVLSSLQIRGLIYPSGAGRWRAAPK